MSATIKGITIEINGDTKKLNKALEDVNKESSSLQGELKQVNKLLKFDPKNTELLAQKQKLLTDSIGNTKTKLDTLKEAERQVQQQFKEGKVGEEQYRAIQREVIATEQKLKGLETQLSNTNDSWKDVSKNLQDAGGKMKDVGGKMSAGVTAPIVGGLVAITEGTRELRMDMGKLEAAFTTSGFTAEQAKAVYTDFYGILGESDTAIEAVNHLAELTSSQEELSDWTTIATGVYAKFGDSLPIEGLTEAANETAKVGQVTGPLADALNWAGVSEDAFNESLAACTTEQERASLITETLSGLYGEAAGKYREVNGEVIKSNEAHARLKDGLAQLGSTFEPILTKLIELLSGMIERFNKLSPEQQKFIGIVVAMAAAIGPLLIVLGTMATAIGALTSPIGIAVAAIAGIIAIGVALMANWDTIKVKAGELGAFIGTKFEQIKTAVSEKMTQAKETIIRVWNQAQTFLSDINLFEIGKNIIQGLINGIGDMAYALSNKVSSLGQNAISSIKNALGIASPSKEFQTVGHYTIDGLIVGITDKLPAVTTAMDKIAGAVISKKDVMVDAGKQLGDAFGESLRTTIQDAYVKATALPGSASNTLVKSSDGKYYTWEEYNAKKGSSGGGSSSSKSKGLVDVTVDEKTGKGQYHYDDGNVEDWSGNPIDKPSGNASLYEDQKPKKKYHDGGWVGSIFNGLNSLMSNLKFDEMPAILQKGEFVLSHKMLNGIASMARGNYAQSTGNTNNSRSITQNVTINSPKHIDPYETARLNRNALKELAMQI